MARTLYQKFRDIWKNKPDKTTPVTAEALNHIEHGIYDNSDRMAIKEIYGDAAINLGRKPETIIGFHSSALGTATEASGDYSVAEGYGTIASKGYQHVFGMYNVEDTDKVGFDKGKYVIIVGNGNYAEKSNAHTLDWDGNAWFAGDVENGAGVTMNALLNRIELLEQRILELEKEE